MNLRFLPDQNYINWFILLLAAGIGLGFSLYGYHQIINIPPPTTLEVRSPYPKNIIIISPKTRQKISNPVIISGRAKTVENDLTIRIRNFNGEILAEQNIKDLNKPALSPFKVTINYQEPATKSGIIEIFEYSPANDVYLCKKTVLIKFSD